MRLFAFRAGAGGYRGRCAQKRWLWLSIALCGAWCAAGLSGCRPPPPAVAETAAAPEDPDSLRAAALPGSSPAALKGRGSCRLHVGDRGLPTLSISYALRASGALGAILRPGLLPPVLGLWAGPDGMSLRLPRERAAFELPDAAEPDALSGRLVARMGWYLLAPGDLLRSLERPRLLSRGGHWIFTGTPREIAPLAARAEIWLEKEDLDIERWSLWLRGGEPLLHVIYEPPVPGLCGSGGSHGLHFVIAPLDTRGTLRLRSIGPTEPTPMRRPPLPSSWNLFPWNQIERRLEVDLGPEGN